MVKVQLKSNFRDFYDSSFDEVGDVVLDRGYDKGPTKREQFRILDEAGFKAPPHGTVGDVLSRTWPEELVPTHREIEWVVVYTDELAHCTEGKKLISGSSLRSNPHMGMPGGDRYWKEKLQYCSAYVHPKGQRTPPVFDKSESLRRLQVGPHTFWILYTSVASWMSNAGEGDIELISYKLNEGFHPHIKLPLFAIDFVPGRSDYYAVDFNIAPGVRGSGVERVCNGDKLVDGIRSFYEEFGELLG